jgi:hypothetical protein
MGIASEQCVMMLSRLIETIALVLLGVAILIVAGGVLRGEIAAHSVHLNTSHARRTTNCQRWRCCEAVRRA